MRRAAGLRPSLPGHNSYQENRMAGRDARPFCLGDLRGLARRFHRQGDEHRTTPAIFAFHPGASAMKLRQSPYQGKAKTGAAGLAVEAIVHLVEGLEDIVELV